LYHLESDEKLILEGRKEGRKEGRREGGREGGRGGRKKGRPDRFRLISLGDRELPLNSGFAFLLDRNFCDPLQNPHFTQKYFPSSSALKFTENLSF
jgi:hypothetical protein